MKILYTLIFLSFAPLFANETLYRFLPKSELVTKLAEMTEENKKSIPYLDITGVNSFTLEYLDPKATVTSFWRGEKLVFLQIVENLPGSVDRIWKIFPNEPAKNIYAGKVAETMGLTESGDNVVKLNNIMKKLIALNSKK